MKILLFLVGIPLLLAGAATILFVPAIGGPLLIGGVILFSAAAVIEAIEPIRDDASVARQTLAAMMRAIEKRP